MTARKSWDKPSTAQESVFMWLSSSSVRDVLAKKNPYPEEKLTDFIALAQKTLDFFWESDDQVPLDGLMIKKLDELKTELWYMIDADKYKRTLKIDPTVENSTLLVNENAILDKHKEFDALIDNITGRITGTIEGILPKLLKGLLGKKRR
ncbi:MAG: hypothetical protein FWH55_06525 [Oscillospiraceae bacterium]|nr:hypothetical protein [Oscillospiraceae bacterium]